jgi:tRNA nucleotidyltransferase/poly(A) polymerase
MAAGNFIQAQKLMKVMVEAGFETRLCGGSIRNQLWSLPVQDYDLATEASPEQTKGVLQASGIRFHLAGEKHGTISALIGGAVYELTTLRQDLKPDGRHSEVSYTQNWAADASRRDFTVNGLYQDLAGNIYDFVGGLADIKDRRLKFIGDPTTRIREDYLRILRFFRFWAQYEMLTDDSTLASLACEKAGLGRLSHERVTSEFRKTLGSRHVADVLAAMDSTGVFALLFGEALPRDFANLIDHPALGREAYSPERRFRLRFFLMMCIQNNQLSLDFPAGALTEKLRTWRLSAQELNIFVALSQSLCHWQEGLPLADLLYEEWANRQGLHQFPLFPELLNPLLRFLVTYPAEEPLMEAKGLAKAIEVFQEAEMRLGQGACLRGEDLIQELGIAPGKELGRLLQDLQKLYLLGPPQSKEKLLMVAKTMHRQAAVPRD